MKLLASFCGLVILALAALHFVILPYYDQKNNAVLLSGPYAVSDKTIAIHSNAFVADLHADSLLWKRDLRQRYKRGQVDLPRLQDGGVDLQIFSVVSKVPSSANYHSNPADSDSLPILFLASLRSPKTWFDPKQRALAQARELKHLTVNAPLSLVLEKGDLSAEGIKGLLALEGMHALNGEKKALNELYSAGYRMMGLAHFFDNEVSGYAHGNKKHGLTKLGRELLPEMEALGITIDLDHASTAAFEDTLDLATKPVVVSHGGVNGTCPGVRNLTDTQLRRVSKNGGVVGIGYWKSAVCDASVRGIVAAILYTIKVAGIDHVGLGSDFDGNVTTPFDVTGLPMLTEAFLAAGLSEKDVGKVLGGNVLRILSVNLPE